VTRAKNPTGGKWFGYTALNPRALCSLDQRHEELINIDGGTWAPETPITFGGAGLKLNAIGSVAGGIGTKPGYGGLDPRIELPASQWPTFSTPSTRTRVVMVDTSKAVWAWHNIGNKTTHPSEFSATGTLTAPATYSHSRFMVAANQLRFHDGATLESAKFYYRYTAGTIAGALAGTYEGFGIWRVDSSGTVQALSSNGTRSGIIYGATYGGRRDLSTWEAFYNNGETIELDYVPDQYNVIDTSAYLYTIQAYEQQPWGLELFGVKLEFTVPDKRFE
jgi:hypothetical protein